MSLFNLVTYHCKSVSSTEWIRLQLEMYLDLLLGLRNMQWVAYMFKNYIDTYNYAYFKVNFIRFGLVQELSTQMRRPKEGLLGHGCRNLCCIYDILPSAYLQSDLNKI